MDVVIAREKKPASAFSTRVDTFAKHNFSPFVLRQDRAQGFEPGFLDLLRESGLFAVELAAYLPKDSRMPLLPEGGTFADTVTAIRAISRVDPAVAVLIHVHNALVVRALLRFGTERQKAQWLPQLARGRTVGAFAATEAHAGSDLSQMQCKIEERGDELVLSGEKHWITNAREAGLFLVFAARKPRGFVAVLVPADASGVTVGETIPKLGMRASSTCTVTFRDVRLGRDAVLGGPNGGMDVALYGLVCGRIGIAAQLLGLAEGAHRLALDYACKRKAFGQTILEFQAVSFPLAQIAAEIAALDLIIKEALLVLETARSHLQAMDLANSAKLLAGQLAERAASRAVDTLGGNGVAEEFAVEKFHRDAKVGRIYEGTENILLRALSNTLIRGGGQC